MRALLARYPGHPRPLRAIGYRQAGAVVRGEETALQAQRDIVKETMRYAKRQMTWFRHQEDARWLGAAEAPAAIGEWLG
jgi:tRNA dimethylallyltransferase